MAVHRGESTSADCGSTARKSPPPMYAKIAHSTRSVTTLAIGFHIRYSPSQNPMYKRADFRNARGGCDTTGGDTIAKEEIVLPPKVIFIIAIRALSSISHPNNRIFPVAIALSPALSIHFAIGCAVALTLIRPEVDPFFVRLHT